MTWPEYLAIQRQWKLWPPTVVSLAILARMTPQERGLNDEEPASAEHQYAQNVEALTGLIGAPPPNGG